MMTPRAHEIEVYPVFSDIPRPFTNQFRIVQIILAQAFSSSAAALAENRLPGSTSALVISAARAGASLPMSLPPEVAKSTIFFPVKLYAARKLSMMEGSRYAEAMLIAYNAKNKHRLPIKKLYGSQRDEELDEEECDDDAAST